MVKNKELNVKTVNRVPGEKETRAAIINLARRLGAEDQIKKIFVKYDDALKGARDEHTYHHIAASGAAEIHKILGCVGPLVINGKEILPGQPGWEDAAASQKGVVVLDQ